MRDLIPGYGHIKRHFHGNARLATAAFLLLVAGAVIFAVNNTILFFIKNDDTYFVPRLCMRFLTSLAWLASAIMGAKWNRTKRNSFLVPALVLYMVADVVVFFSIPASALFYGAGHVFLLIAIQQTTYFRKYQFVVFFIAVPLMIFSLIHFLDGFSLVVLLATLYGMICVAMMSASLSNRFFQLGGVVFLVSDLAGLARVELMNNHVTYVITSFIYYLAIFLLSASVYNESRKENVTRSDFLKLMKLARNHGVRMWVSGKWAVGFAQNKHRTP